MELKKIYKNPILLLILVSATILIAVGIILLVNNRSANQSPNNNPLEDLLQDKVYIPFDNSQNLVVGSNRISLPQNWGVKSYFSIKDPKATLTCQPPNISIDLVDCEIYEISNENEIFYISNYPYLINSTNIDKNVTEEEVKFLQTSNWLKMYTTEVVERTDLTEGGESKLLETRYVSQAYVCSNGICLSSGYFSLDTKEASRQLAEFKNLIGQVTSL